MALSGSFIIPRTSGTQYLQGRVEWSATQDAVANTSTVRARMIFRRTNTGYTTYGTGTFDMDLNGSAFTTGSISYSFTSSDTVVLDKTVTISHNADGTRDFYISASYTGDTPIGGSGGQIFTLNAIDRTAPSVSLTLSGITSNSITVNASSNTTCDIWQYTTNNGSTWTSFSTASATAASKVITGLSPSVTYTIKVRARRKSNHVYGSSSAKSAATLGGTVLNSVGDVTIDTDSPSVDYTVTVYNESYTNTLRILNGSEVLLELDGLVFSKGTITQTLSFTAEQKESILQALSADAEITAAYEITSYDSTAQIGSPSTKIGKISTSSLSYPVWSNEEGFTYADTNPETVAVTGNNQTLIQTHSNLVCTAYPATAKNHASIVSYSVTCSGVTVSEAGTALEVGSLSGYGTITLTVTATDSRGYSVSKTKEIDVLQYAPIAFEDYLISRVNMVEAYCNLEFEARFASVAGLNTVAVCQYRFKTSDAENYGDWFEITPIVGTEAAVYTSSDFGNFDADYSYDIEFQIADKFQSDTITLSLPNGKPLAAFRKEKIGINNPNPTEALDVTGNIAINGKAIADFIIEQETYGTWTYQKWNSGVAELWGYTQLTNVPITNTNNDGYYFSNVLSSDVLPFSIVAGSANVEFTCANAGMWCTASSMSSATQYVSFRANRIKSATSSVNVYIQVKAKWK